MTKLKYRWWTYARRMVEDYPELCAQPENMLNERDRQDRMAVERALVTIDQLTYGGDLRELLHYVYWSQRNRKTLPGAAQALHISYGTAKRWNGIFLRAVGGASRAVMSGPADHGRRCDG